MRKRSGMLGLLGGIVLLAGLVGGRPVLGMVAPIEWAPGRPTGATLGSADPAPAAQLGQALFLLGKG